MRKKVYKPMKFACQHVDKLLFKVISLIEAVLVTEEVPFTIEERRENNIFLYYVTNTKLGLDGYIGRDISTQELIFIVQDKARIAWSEKEGFSREEAFEKVGVLIRLNGMTSFVNFIGAKGHPYKFFGDERKYITAP